MENKKRHPCFVSEKTAAKSLIQEDPPSKALKPARQSKWGNLVPVLKRNPDKWYRMQHYENDKSASSAVTKLRKEYRGQGFEFVHHDGKLWGRHVTRTEETATSQGMPASTLVDAEHDNGSPVQQT